MNWKSGSRKLIPILSLGSQKPSGRTTTTILRKLLQVITALIPSELWPKPKEKDDPKKVYTYSMKSKCLKEFQEIHKRVKNPPNDLSAEDRQNARSLYEFYLDIAPIAHDLYEKWKRHPGFSGT